MSNTEQINKILNSIRFMVSYVTDVNIDKLAIRVLGLLDYIVTFICCHCSLNEIEDEHNFFFNCPLNLAKQN